MQPRDRRAGGAARAHRAAVRREPPDARLQMDRQQIGQKHRPNRLFLPNVQFLRIDRHWDGRRDALIAAAGNDAHRQLAAAHARVRACGGHRLCPVLHAVSVVPQQHGADVRAPIAAQPFLRDGEVHPELPLDHRLHRLQLHLFGKRQNPFDAQAAPVGQVGGLRRGRVLPLQDHAVLLDQYNVRMIFRDTELHAMFRCPQREQQIKRQLALRGPHLNTVLFQIGRDLPLFLFRDRADDLQPLLRLPGDQPGGDRRLDAGQAVRVRHNHALDIFDEVAAGLHQNLLRQTAQDLPCARRAVCNGNRLRTAHRWDQLFPQDLQKRVLPDW